MTLGWELERIFRDKESGAGEGGGTATGVDIVRGSGNYSATDPGYGDEQKPAKPKDESAESAEPAAETEATEEDTGGETPEDATEQAPEPLAEEEEAFSDDLLDRAVALGYEAEDILKFRSPKSLERDIERAEQIAARLAQKMQGKKTTEKPQAPQEPNWDEKKAAGYDEWQIDQMRSDYQRSVEAHQKAMEAHAEIEKLRQETAQLQAMREREAIIASEQRFDNQVAQLVKENKGYKELLGEGMGSDHEKTSKEFQNRVRLYRRSLTIQNEYREAGLRVPSEKQVFQEAVGSLFNGHVHQVVRQKLKEDIKEAGKQALTRPQSASKAGLTGHQKAEERVEEFWRTHS